MLSGLLVAAALGGIFEISDRSELRVRDPGDIGDTASVDLETAVEARLTLASRLARLRLLYAPRLTLWNVNIDPNPTLMQAAGLGVDWHNRLARWWFDQAGSYGGVNLTALSVTPGVAGALPRVDALPYSRVIQYASSMTRLGMRLTSRRWAFEWLVGYQLAGGADADARTVLPMQTGPVAEGKLDYTAGRRWHLVTELEGTNASFSSGPEALLVRATEGLRYALNRTTFVELDAGAAEARVRPSDTLASIHNVYPVAEASWEQGHTRVHDRFVLRAAVGIAPVINPLLGSIDERAQVSARATWTFARLALNVFATAQQTVPTDDPNAVQLLAGEVSTSYATGNVLAVDAGVRALAEKVNQPVSPGSSEFTQTSFVQGIFFLGLSLRAHPIRW